MLKDYFYKNNNFGKSKDFLDQNIKMINLLKKLLLKRDNSKKFDARVWIQLELLNKNLKSLKY